MTAWVLLYSLIYRLTDILVSISVVLCFSLNYYYTSYPQLPLWICLTRLTSIRHLCSGRFSKAKMEVASSCHLLAAHCSLLTAHCSVLTAQYSLVNSQPASRPASARKVQPIRCCDSGRIHAIVVRTISRAPITGSIKLPLDRCYIDKDRWKIPPL
jgi:hypothetical protein